MNHWIFKCYPEFYDLEKRLADQEPRLTWDVTRCHKLVTVDDVAFIWQTGNMQGIRAAIRIESSPQLMPQMDSERKFSTIPDTSVGWRVYATILRRELNISTDTLRKIEGLDGLFNFHNVTAPIYQMAPFEANILKKLIE